MAAEMAAREMGHIWLADALALTVLAVEKSPGKRNAYTVRFLRRLLEEHENLTIDEAVLAASALAALGGRSHGQAHATLSAITDRATTPERSEARKRR
jgi:hypothetical protein